MNDLGPRLFVWLQRLLPRYSITRLFYWVTRIRAPAVKNFLINRFVSLYDVNIAEVSRAVPDGYESFNAFFTRELRDNARPIDATGTNVVSPVDGTLSACGTIDGQHIFQAKGHSYTLTDLLAINLEDARQYEGGSFATIYLAPYNYHRIHAPTDGRLGEIHHIPGDLFSVNTATVSRLGGIFARNERLVCHLTTPTSPMCVIFVGALNVGSISTPWTGELKPVRTGNVRRLDLDPATPMDIDKGDLLGWFNMGSTVILLFPPSSVRWDERLVPGKSVRMGESIGRRIGDEAAGTGTSPSE